MTLKPSMVVGVVGRVFSEKNQSKVFANYEKFVPPSYPHVPINLKIDLTGVNKVEPANSYYDGNFLWRVKWQA